MCLIEMSVGLVLYDVSDTLCLWQDSAKSKINLISCQVVNPHVYWQSFSGQTVDTVMVEWVWY